MAPASVLSYAIAKDGLDFAEHLLLPPLLNLLLHIAVAVLVLCWQPGLSELQHGIAWLWLRELNDHLHNDNSNRSGSRTKVGSWSTMLKNPQTEMKNPQTEMSPTATRDLLVIFCTQHNVLACTGLLSPLTQIHTLRCLAAVKCPLEYSDLILQM